MCAKIFLLTLIKLTEPGPPSIHPNNANFDLPRRQIKRRTRGENKLTSPAACPSIVVPSCRLTVLRVSTTQVVVENGKVCGEKRRTGFSPPSLYHSFSSCTYARAYYNAAQASRWTFLLPLAPSQGRLPFYFPLASPRRARINSGARPPPQAHTKRTSRPAQVQRARQPPTSFSSSSPSLNQILQEQACGLPGSIDRSRHGALQGRLRE